MQNSKKIHKSLSHTLPANLRVPLSKGDLYSGLPPNFRISGGSSPASHPPLQPQGRHVTGNPSPSDSQPVAMGINLTLPLLIGSLQESWRVVFVTPRSVPAINKIFGGDAVGLRACIPTIKHKSFSSTGGVQASYGTRKLWSVYIFICINSSLKYLHTRTNRAGF